MRGLGIRPLRALGVALLAAAAALALAGPPGAGASLRAGAAHADITPPIGTPMFAYTARSGLANPGRIEQILADPDTNLYAKTFEPSKGIHTRLRASALVLERRGVRYALISADLGGLPYTLLKEVERRVSHLGLTIDRMLVTATHTHAGTGPIWSIDNLGYGVLGGDVFDSRVFELTAAGIAEAIELATERTRPARAGVARVRVEGASRNRSLDPHLLNGDVPADPERARERSVNPTLTAIRVDAIDGSPIGVWSSFAVHPTSLGDGNLHFSGDNVATAQRVVERRLRRGSRRGPAPVSVWANGAEGDVSPDATPELDPPDAEPVDYVPTEYARANLVGKRVAAGIVRAWHRAGRSMSRTIALDSRRLLTSFDGREADGEPVGPLVVLGVGGIVGPDGACAPFEGMAGPGQGWKLPLLVAPGLPGVGLITPLASISLWRVGEVGIAALPFEITTQMGRRIAGAAERAAAGRLGRVAIAGLANGYLSYVATPEEYDACHYEGSFTLFGRRQGARLRDATVSLVDPLLGGAAPPESALEPPAIALGSDELIRPSPTPAAGEIDAQPPASVRRTERVSFSWRGGDAIVDPPRGASLVLLQRRAGRRWRRAGSEDDPASLTTYERGSATWTHSRQLRPCTPRGRYRFVATGSAVRGDGDPEPYRAVSRPFRVRSIRLELLGSERRGGRIRIRAAYPDPGEALIALPRTVRIDAPRRPRADRGATRDRCGNPVAG